MGLSIKSPTSIPPAKQPRRVTSGGRPPRSPTGETRTQALLVKMTVDEKNFLVDAASQCALDMSEFTRRALAFVIASPSRLQQVRRGER